MKRNGFRITIWMVLFLGLSTLLYGQTTGKIAGKVIDDETGEALIGANVILQGTTMGAATDIDGSYFIINVPPGKYDIKISMVGYSSMIVTEVTVSVNRTANVDGRLKLEDLELGEIVVSVAAVAQKKDLTSSIKNVSSEQIEALPVENIGDVVNMQAGVVNGHFRGGRKTEVSYMVDGMPVMDGFKREDKSVTIETESVQDLEVITGTFNAEYGRAMSGIVNMVTKNGSNNRIMGNATVYQSAYLTSNNDIFIGLDKGAINKNQDYKIQLEGPILKDYVTFFTNLRYQKELGYLNGIRRFNVNDYSNFSNAGINNGIETPWDAEINNKIYYSEHTGDNDYVPMEESELFSFLGKLSFNILTDVRLSMMYTRNQKEYQDYNHDYKYRPDGRETYYNTSEFFIFQLNQILSNNIFHDFKASYSINDNETYLYKDPFDSRYVADNYSTGAAGFYTGGQHKGYSQVVLKDLNLKYDLIWQVNKNHSIKTGVVFTNHNLTSDSTVVRDVKWGTSEYNDYYYDETTGKLIFPDYEAEILDSSVSSEDYNKKPYEISAYIQDKMEYDNLVINFGLRYDYFNANTVYPSQLRNPGNQLSFPNNPERMSDYLDAEPQSQFSPRFGLSYTLGSAAVLHFSYGHFFQMPPLYALYQNSKFLVPSGDYATIHGNPNLKAEKTVQYEMGIWMEIMPRMGLELSVFYRDIYDLQTAIVVTTYNQVKYGLYSNKDYGNTKGIEVKYDYFTGPFSVNVNYTLMYTKGNADTPTSSFNRAGQSIDAISKLIPLSWDQRHTANLSLGYSKGNFGANITAYYNSGLAYTYEPISESPLSKQTLYPNNSYRPAQFNVDLKANYDFKIFNDIDLRLFLLVYNLFDTLNEVAVNSTTGRAYTAIIRPTQISTFKSNFNDIYDQYQDPSMYAAPREIKIGVGIGF